MASIDMLLKAAKQPSSQGSDWREGGPHGIEGNDE